MFRFGWPCLHCDLLPVYHKFHFDLVIQHRNQINQMVGPSFHVLWNAIISLAWGSEVKIHSSKLVQLDVHQPVTQIRGVLAHLLELFSHFFSVL